MRSMLLLVTVLSISIFAFAEDQATYWIKIKAKNRFERSFVADMGISIESTDKDYVIGFGNKEELARLKKSGRVITSFEIKKSHMRDFPANDKDFHNYQELMDEMNLLVKTYPDLVELKSIGKTHENRDLWVLRITKDVKSSVGNRPAAIFMGGHHAREHVSVETPFKLAQYLLSETAKGNQQIANLIAAREIHIIPMVNPDGLEFDVSTGSYKLWRKNRSKNSGDTMGTDLNRNYGFGWGTGGSSTSGSSDVFMGTKPFSEPESQAIKAYVESNTNITILLSFHTFSELILYPWGHKYDSISDANDLKVHETMAKTMSAWNGYTPQQSSDLYIASGDTTDWSYGEHRIISFTFELDPKAGFMNQIDPKKGFYPGQSVIQSVFDKNLKPVLYMIDLADNPYRVLSSSLSNYGLTTPLVN